MGSRSHKKKKKEDQAEEMLGLGRFLYREIGYYTVPYGVQDTEFEFDYYVETVLLSCPSLEMPVCQGDLNWFSVTLLPQGFILHTDIKTDSATLMWLTVQGLGPQDD